MRMESTHTMYANTRTGKLLWYLWDMVDITENMKRVKEYIIEVDNGFDALWHSLVFALLSLATFAGAWYFDIESTIIGMKSFTDLVVPSLPGQSARLTWWIIAAITALPTLLELFSGGIAKKNVKIVQLAIIGFTLFDAVTDIPRVYGFTLQLWPQIQLLGWGVDWFVFYAYFIVTLFFATLGIEVLAVLFGYLTVSFIWKIFHGDGSYNIRGRKSTTQTIISNGSKSKDDEIIIV